MAKSAVKANHIALNSNALQIQCRYVLVNLICLKPLDELCCYKWQRIRYHDVIFLELILKLLDMISEVLHVKLNSAIYILFHSILEQ